MNELIAGIYGTAGFEKTAAVSGEGQLTLSDLALIMVNENLGEGAEFEKVASAHEPVLEHLVAYDRAGRALAHNEFAELEKAAAEGNVEPLQQFFADIGEEEEDLSERDHLKQAILEELARRDA